MTDTRCIGVCTGGGDAPASTLAILKYRWKVIGIPDGFDGLIWPERSHELTLKDVSGILPRGGTILGTTNRGNPFQYKTVENGREVVKDISDPVIANARTLGMDAIITIGGDGSQKIARELFQKGMKLVGVPKTIDNDISATDVAARSSFIAKLAYKAESAGRWLVKGNARGTSQPCLCGAPVPKKLWDRKHPCLACGLKTTRDHASALEILRRGLRLRTETPAIAGVALEAPSFSYGA
jgi:hypothetical protein